ncbi:hypothetical protein MA16_Dca016923 [Dendrobium catenatum]|uniref:Uncharacterized protein n=1 Tax=Dendrobium catenatum TaxID=906689 RepID=A0A2I0XI91_9ASPA|nr:hypothetical protein MA16_Dca016923 [Dendrobium catenatum]
METMEVSKELEELVLNMDLIDNAVDKDVLNICMVSLNSIPYQISENRFQILVNEDMDEEVLFVKSGEAAVKEILCKDGAIAREDVMDSIGFVNNSVCDGNRSRGEKNNSGTGDVIKSKLVKEIRSLGPIFVNSRGRTSDGSSRKKVGVLILKKFSGFFSHFEL